MPKPIPNQEDEDPTPYLFVSLEQKRIDQSKPYDSKKACWIPDDKEGYLLGEIKATKGEIVSVGIAGGEVSKPYNLTDTHQIDAKPKAALTMRCDEFGKKNPTHTHTTDRNNITIILQIFPQQ